MICRVLGLVRQVQSVGHGIGATRDAGRRWLRAACSALLLLAQLLRVTEAAVQGQGTRQHQGRAAWRVVRCWPLSAHHEPGRHVGVWDRGGGVAAALAGGPCSIVAAGIAVRCLLAHCSTAGREGEAQGRHHTSHQLRVPCHARHGPVGACRRLHARCCHGLREALACVACCSLRGIVKTTVFLLIPVVRSLTPMAPSTPALACCCQPLRSVPSEVILDCLA
mmetsp:Transcript_19359/g.49255  ORF Transcript_19359/g.49255 Transcript_19359/m.49255 type:complete len:222 (+) Transcript_19359:1692-2357(+)